MPEKMSIASKQCLPSLRLELLKLCPALRCVWSDLISQNYGKLEMLRTNNITEMKGMGNDDIPERKSFG